MKEIMELLDDDVCKNGQLFTYFTLHSLGDNKEELLLEILNMRLNAGL